MERKTIITWLDVAKLAIGIMIGLTPALLIMKGDSVLDSIAKAAKETKTSSPNITMTEDQDTIFIASFCDEYYKTPSTEDVLNIREELRYSLWVDSIYLAIPEDILVRILTDKGTQESVIKIVEEYIKNKEQYQKNLYERTLNQ
ncbi:MAG: hypothetical protein J6I70_07410 [Bacteroidaceae bacterium]|nr:hypothetical protein [Bacteroidaceae bacterium]